MIRPEDIQGSIVLISPLNWGMGHVARCIPLINRLKKQGNHVILACDASQAAVFKEYFPEITVIDHPGYPFFFGGKGKFGRDLFVHFRKLHRFLRNEERQVEEWVSKFGVDFVISDHRYGFRSKVVPSIFLSHQINLPVQRWEFFVQRMHYTYLRQFNTLWIPDSENSDFAGKLSRNKMGFPVIYLGVLSRFELYAPVNNSHVSPPVIIVSGPSVYAQQFVNSFSGRTLADEKCVFIGDGSLVYPANARVVSNDWRLQDQTILGAAKVYSRSGYSTVMDMVYLNKKARYFPTPGQREQEYLNQLHSTE